MRDEIDLTAAVLVNAPSVRDWPVTAEITRVEVAPDNVRFAFTKSDGPDRWPDQVLPGFEGPLQYTVWLFLNLGGIWYASGFIEMWHEKDGVGDGISDFVKNWYYDAARWAPMTGHAIEPGETIGFMLTAGDARNGGNTNVRERSNIIAIEVPPNDGATRGFVLDDAPPAPTPTTPPIVPPEDGEQLAALIDEFKASLDALRDGLAAVVVRLDRLAEDGIKVHL